MRHNNNNTQLQSDLSFPSISIIFKRNNFLPSKIKNSLIRGNVIPCSFEFRRSCIYYTIRDNDHRFNMVDFQNIQLHVYLQLIRNITHRIAIRFNGADYYVYYFCNKIWTYNKWAVRESVLLRLRVVVHQYNIASKQSIDMAN